MRLLPAHIDQFVVTRNTGAVGVRATVKQILNTSVACARGLRDYETYFSEDDSSNCSKTVSNWGASESDM